ncbi:chemotaxis protein CheW [Aquabacterium sp. OR-4]|uniref:chemotaxis protein CheW n=1 Tax=Aquabacterium sp. OR-4 TaxID=2978127 RepID=UPI0021B278BE|nr:chemotaxis protein CheW [Aquabacterium sp. OR-4]MDT7835394.1 chemotaxis protein CheW [Aquabacterium sp. OR-4]
MQATTHTPTASAAAAAAAASSGAPAVQMLRFAVGEERFAVRIDAVREILEVARTTPLPLMPSFVRGVMNLRGAVVPVIDLGARLGLDPSTVGRRSCVVIVETSGNAEVPAMRLGMLVDAVYEVFDALPDALESVPRLGTRIDPAFIRSMARLRGQTTAELNLDAVLEAGALAALIDAHQGLH